MPIDAPTTNQLLDIVIKTAAMPNLRAINEAATVQLVQINADLEAELRPPPAEEMPVETPVEEAA